MSLLAALLLAIVAACGFSAESGWPNRGAATHDGSRALKEAALAPTLNDTRANLTLLVGPHKTASTTIENLAPASTHRAPMAFANGGGPVIATCAF